MVKQRKETRAWAWVIFGLLFVGGVVASTQIGSVTTINNNATSTAGSVEEAPDVNAQKIEEIKSRAEIKHQQELLVKETFLKEEKARAEELKTKALASLDAQIAALEQAKASTTESYDEEIKHFETGLEEVRAEKIDFQ